MITTKTKQEIHPSGDKKKKKIVITVNEGRKSHILKA